MGEVIFLVPNFHRFATWRKEKTDNESNKARDILAKAGIPLKTRINSDPQVTVPIIIDGEKEYKGLEQIKRFVEKWQENNASQRHGCGCGSGCGCAE